MLAKARSDVIARRAALTAPTGFLPRLLLCSGLPRASLLTMIDRLGKMGDGSSEKDAVFNKLLVPSAASEWDIGRLGQRREVARKLLGRLSAYLRLNDVSVDKDKSTISTTFLEWLSQECSSNEKSKKPRHKQKTKSTAVDMAKLSEFSSILKTIDVPNEVKAEDYRRIAFDDELDIFLPVKVPDNTEKLKMRDKIKHSIEQTQPDVLEPLLTQVLDKDAQLRPKDKDLHLLDIAVFVMKTFLNLETIQHSITRIILAYVPRLSQISGNPELWQQLFSSQQDERNEVLDLLLCRCTASWHPHHIASCYEWLISIGKTMSPKYCVARITRYLVVASGQQSVHIEGFSTKITLDCIKSWGMSEEFASSTLAFAFEGMKQATSVGSWPGLLSRNGMPDWFILLLLLAKCGRVQMKFVGEALLQRIAQPSNDLSLPLLRAVFLRLYVSNPQGMNLGTALIRNVLMEAGQEYAVSWLVWRSPLDDQIEDMLDTVMSGAGQRLIRPLADLSKKHPLLMLRKCHLLTQFLETDGTVPDFGTKDNRGVVQGQSLTGPLNAIRHGKMVRVNVRHWGFRYTEYIWVALLDIICAGECHKFVSRLAVTLKLLSSRTLFAHYFLRFVFQFPFRFSLAVA